MRPLVLTALIATTLAACGPTAAPDAEAPKAAATPAPAAPAPAPAPVAETPKPPEAAAPAKEIPEGECGDQSKVPAEQRLANTARWSTASEQNNFGFDVFRGDSEKGEFAKLTKEPIPGAGTTDETHDYSYRDDTIDPCKEYWYYIEQTNTNGTKEKISPVFRAGPKRRPVGSPAPQPVEAVKE